MPLSPQEIAEREFFPSKDGYDKEEVRAFLNVMARDQSELLDRIQSLTAGPEDLAEIGTQVSDVLGNAGSMAERLVRAAEAKASEIRSQAEEEADMLRTATADSTDRLKEEAEQYAYDVRTSAERASREQQVQAVDRVGRLLAGESTVRERLYNLELTLQSIRGELKGAAEGVYPELAKIPPPLPEKKETPALESDEDKSLPVIDLRDERSQLNGSNRR